MTFHITTDYHTLHKGCPLHAGDVIRVFDGPFCDAVILGFDEKGNAKLCRPYVYATGTGTTGPHGLLGSEVFEVTPKVLANYLAANGIIAEGRAT